jgi:lipid-A-disaccharide synthase
VDRLAVILPFEEAFFRSHGIPATYVGHPLFDSLAERPPDPEAVAAIRARGQPVVAVLPGSRRHVVQEVLPGQLEVVDRIRERFPEAHIGVSEANPRVADVIDRAVASCGLPATKYRGQNADLLAAADLALVASGTATLEVAYRHTPMIVMYNANRWAYRLIGRWLLRMRHLCLVNIIAGREVVPEFMPYYTSTRPIAARALELLDDADARLAMSNDLAELIDPLAQPGASGNTARMLLEMLDARAMV